MGIKYHRFLLAALFLTISALARSAFVDADLSTGETRLPSGVVVRIDDAASSAEEYVRNLQEKFGVTPEARQKKAAAVIPLSRLYRNVSKRRAAIDDGFRLAA